MKKSSLLLLAPLSLLFAELPVDLVTESNQEIAPFSRDQLIESRDKAIKAREETSKSLRNKAEDIYETRLVSKDDKQKVIIEPVVKKVKKLEKVTISSKPIKTKELNNSK